MPVFRWGQFFDDAFRDLEHEVDRLLEGMNLSLAGRLSSRYPLINLYELDDRFLLTAQIPGTRAADLEITVAGGLLTLKGVRQGPPDVPEEAYRRQERLRGTWERTVSIPNRVDEDGMIAEINDGVLRIQLPKSSENTPRQIRVVEDTE